MAVPAQMMAVRAGVRRWGERRFESWKGSFLLTSSRSPPGDYVPASPDPSVEGHCVSLLLPPFAEGLTALDPCKEAGWGGCALRRLRWRAGRSWAVGVEVGSGGGGAWLGRWASGGGGADSDRRWRRGGRLESPWQPPLRSASPVRTPRPRAESPPLRPTSPRLASAASHFSGPNRQGSPPLRPASPLTATPRHRPLRQAHPPRRASLHGWRAVRPSATGAGGENAVSPPGGFGRVRPRTPQSGCASSTTKRSFSTTRVAPPPICVTPPAPPPSEPASSLRTPMPPARVASATPTSPRLAAERNTLPRPSPPVCATPLAPPQAEWASPLSRPIAVADAQSPKTHQSCLIHISACHRTCTTSVRGLTRGLYRPSSCSGWDAVHAWFRTAFAVAKP